MIADLTIAEDGARLVLRAVTTRAARWLGRHLARRRPVDAVRGDADRLAWIAEAAIGDGLTVRGED